MLFLVFNVILVFLNYNVIIQWRTIAISCTIPQKIILNLLKRHLSAMGSCLFLLDHLSCLSHYKTCWTMLVHLLGLKYIIWGPRPSWSLCHFFFGVNRSGHKTSQQPIAYGECNWELMVHKEHTWLSLGHEGNIVRTYWEHFNKFESTDQ